MYGHRSSGNCGSCGGHHHPPPALPPAPSDPCAGGLVSSAAPRETGCGCGGRCGGRCAAGAARPRTYGNCAPWRPSCETQDALRDCVKVALCDLLRCVSDTLCPDGVFDMANFRDRGDDEPSVGEELVNCFGQALCSFMHCLPDALCPEVGPGRAPIDCLPCDYAVEVVR